MQFSLVAESYSPTRAKRWLGQFPPTGLFLPWSCPVIYLDFSFSNAIKSKVKVAFASCFQSTHIWETPVSHSLPAGPFFAVIKPQKSKKTTPKKPPHHEIWWVFFSPLLVSLNFWISFCFPCWLFSVTRCFPLVLTFTNQWHLKDLSKLAAFLGMSLLSVTEQILSALCFFAEVHQQSN